MESYIYIYSCHYREKRNQQITQSTLETSGDGHARTAMIGAKLWSGSMSTVYRAQRGEAAHAASDPSEANVAIKVGTRWMVLDASDL